MDRKELIEIKARSSTEKLDFVVDTLYDVREDQQKMAESIRTIKVNQQDPSVGLITRVNALEKTKGIWNKLLWIVAGSTVGFLVLVLLRTVVTAAASAPK